MAKLVVDKRDRSMNICFRENCCQCENIFAFFKRCPQSAKFFHPALKCLLSGDNLFHVLPQLLLLRAELFCLLLGSNQQVSRSLCRTHTGNDCRKCFSYPCE